MPASNEPYFQSRISSNFQIICRVLILIVVVSSWFFFFFQGHISSSSKSISQESEVLCPFSVSFFLDRMSGLVRVQVVQGTARTDRHVEGAPEWLDPAPSSFLMLSWFNQCRASFEL